MSWDIRLEQNNFATGAGVNGQSENTLYWSISLKIRKFVRIFRGILSHFACNRDKYIVCDIV